VRQAPVPGGEVPDGDGPKRRLLLVRGRERWCEDWVAARVPAAAREDLLWVARRSAVLPDPLPAHRVAESLGGECGLLVFNAHQGFHPDAFAAAAGMLRGGGDCVVLLPSVYAWREFADPDLTRLLAHPHDPHAAPSPFLDRLLAQWETSPDVTIVSEEVTVPAGGDTVPGVASRPCGPLRLNPDQQALVAAIRRVAHGHARRPLVVLADRGRGKSTALGVAARELLRAGLRRVTVVAPGRAAVATLFRHALEAPSAEQAAVRDVAIGGGELRFRLPQDLSDGADPGLVLVDEAAALPVAVLAQLLGATSRLVFATTVHGYEGSGRGFLLRFGRLLDAAMPQWRRHTLDAPVRWAPGDPLERLLNGSLLLDAELPQRDAGVGHVVVDLLPRAALAADAVLLRDVVGLLVNAHYQTRPSDLRQLLDNPDLQLFVARDAGGLLGVAVVLHEGRFDPGLAAAIMAGERRPRGHLLPQSLAVHGGLAEMLTCGTARVQRIAVHPGARRRGIGRALLDAVADRAARSGLDLVGCAFAADPDLLDFWLRSDFLPVRVGLRCDPAAGAPSLFLLRGLDVASVALASEAARRFRHGLPWSLGIAQRALDPALAVRLLRGRDCTDLAYDPVERRELGRLARGERPLLAGDHLAWRALVMLAAAGASPPDGLAPAVAWLLQGTSPARVCGRWSLKGRRALEERVRILLAQAC
jgi:tRNA(Met) cytidine acetyltransferase